MYSLVLLLRTKISASVSAHHSTFMLEIKDPIYFISGGPQFYAEWTTCDLSLNKKHYFSFRSVNITLTTCVGKGVSTNNLSIEMSFEDDWKAHTLYPVVNSTCRRDQWFSGGKWDTFYYFGLYDCFNISSVVNKIKKSIFMFRTNIRYHKDLQLLWWAKTFEPSQKRNWIYAKEFCEERNMQLPVFTQTTDIEEMITVIKLRNDLPPLEAIYIGLFSLHEVGIFAIDRSVHVLFVFFSYCSKFAFRDGNGQVQHHCL